jgi:hypothetical protein
MIGCNSSDTTNGHVCVALSIVWGPGHEVKSDTCTE